jgi:hypothetical protein
MNEPQPTRERRDMNVHVIVIFFGSLIVTGILVSLVARGVVAYFARRYPAAVESPLPPVANPGPPVSVPILLANPAETPYSAPMVGWTPTGASCAFPSSAPWILLRRAVCR